MQPGSQSYKQTRASETEAEHAESNPDIEPPKTNTRDCHGALSINGWGLELLSSLISVLLFLGMVIMFRIMDGKEDSKWPFPISLNAATAILSTCCSAAMMHNVSAFIGQQKWIHFKRSSRAVYNIEIFDEASRGPYGSILLLLRIPWNISTIGALITILRLGFSPFSQAAINLESGVVNIPDNSSSFGYTHTFDTNMSFGHMGGQLAKYYIDYKLTIYTVDIPQDPMMQTAILQGLYDIRPIPLSHCDDICNWTDDYISLGFRSDCTNVTASTLKTMDCIAPHNVQPEVCNVTTPGNITLTTHHLPGKLQTTFRINTTRTISNDRPNSMNGLENSMRDIARFAVYQSDYDPVSFNTTSVNITECSIGFAVFKYGGAQANGDTFRFTQVDTLDIQDIDWVWEPRFGESPTYIVSNTSSTRHLPFFRLSTVDILALLEFFESSRFRSEYISGAYENKNPGLNDALEGDVNIAAAIHNMVKSMTDYIRSGPNSKRAVGEAIELRNFVSINWRWLIGPAILELAALIFAVCTIMATTGKHEVPLWKSSALVLLNAQYDKNMGTIHGQFEDVKDLEKMAKSSKARLG